MIAIRKKKRCLVRKINSFIKRLGFILLVLSLTVNVLAACNLPYANEDPPPGEPMPGKPPPGEPVPEEPPPGEPMPEEPPPAEPMLEEPPPGEPIPNEPLPGQPAPTQQSPSQPGAGTGNWSTDVAVTDIYPGNQPTGQFHVRITNNGPGTLNNVNVEVLCGYYSVDKNNGAVGPSKQANLNLKLSIKPGETQKFPTSLNLDLSTFEYTVGCDVFPGFNDPDPGNNSYTETFK